MPSLQDTTSRTAPEAQGPSQSLLDYAVSNSPVIFYIAEVGGLQPLKFISSNVEAITGHGPGIFLNTVGARRNLIHPEDLPAFRNLSTTLRHRRFLFTDSFLLLWKWRVG